MTSPVRDWRVELVEAYPELFHPLPDHPGVAQGSPSCGDGWRDLLERACARIWTAVQADGGTFHATQIKEKFGRLRFYWNGALFPAANAKVEEAINLADARSTCEICGEVGRLYGFRWLTTRCEAHADGRHVVEIKQHLQNVRVEERIAGDRRQARCRRYDRETDSFVDADPSSLGIDEA